MSGVEIRDAIAAALREAGEAVGDGPLFAEIVRPGPTTGPEWEPVPGPPTTIPVVVVEGTITVRDATGTPTGAIARTLMIEAGVTIPQKGDTIIVRGIQHTISEVSTLAPAGVDLSYKVVLSR